MGDLRLTLRSAGESDHDAIIGLIDEAAEWLREMNTDQWAQPWPSKEDRSERILTDLAAGKTWMVLDGDHAAATITADRSGHLIWPAGKIRDQAVYVRRLVVSRSHAGIRLGASLLDWAGIGAVARYGARWIRVDVWRTNKALHAYYERQGFVRCGDSADPDYPSGALFEKPTRLIRSGQALPFREVPADGGP